LTTLLYFYLGPVSASERDTIFNCRTHAQQLLIWRFSGLSISRSAVEELGMTRRRWQWARALLETARIHDGQDVTATDFDGAVMAVDVAIRQLQRNGLESLKMRLPQHVLLQNFYVRAGKGVGKKMGDGDGE
jgi:hypothetical protein